MGRNVESLLPEQLEYYRQRAPEYDEWFFREGRYDRGPELKRQWLLEVEHIRRALADSAPFGRILDLACGTGLWTEFLIQFAAELTAVDASPEMLRINRDRVNSDRVRYLEANLFHWEPDQRYDFVFFGFWLSHVPPPRFERFWSMVDSCLEPAGRVFFVDSLRNPDSTARDHDLGDPVANRVKRRLNSGREFEIVKVFYTPQQLGARLAELGWAFDVRQTPHFFLYAMGGIRRA